MTVKYDAIYEVVGRPSPVVLKDDVVVGVISKPWPTGFTAYESSVATLAFRGVDRQPHGRRAPTFAPINATVLQRAMPTPNRPLHRIELNTSIARNACGGHAAPKS